jgi:hypothetical protein
MEPSAIFRIEAFSEVDLCIACNLKLVDCDSLEGSRALESTFFKVFKSEKERAFTISIISFWTVFASAAVAKQRTTTTQASKATPRMVARLYYLVVDSDVAFSLSLFSIGIVFPPEHATTPPPTNYHLQKVYCSRLQRYGRAEPNFGSIFAEL